MGALHKGQGDQRDHIGVAIVEGGFCSTRGGDYRVKCFEGRKKERLGWFLQKTFSHLFDADGDDAGGGEDKSGVRPWARSPLAAPLGSLRYVAKPLP